MIEVGEPQPGMLGIGIGGGARRSKVSCQGVRVTIIITNRKGL
jgi:hypothetical protein